MKKSAEYDIAIVGAGPGGATTAYYAAEYGLSAALLEKERFPRRKICGDAVTIRAQYHLRAMGVLQEIEDEKKGRWAALGGLVSPAGITYIGDSEDQLGKSLVIAVKREILDEKAAKAAAAKGADLKEGYYVTDVIFDDEEGLWRVVDMNGKEITAALLILADGASSLLARTLGVVPTPAGAVCSSAYIKAGTHSYEPDGVVYYPDYLIPGYAAVFKEADGDLVFCCYIVPGGAARPPDLKELHYKTLREYEPVVSAIGPNAMAEEMKSAPLRLGGEKKSFGDHLLIVGDAAGQIDPLTGEGIQYAMDAGAIAAKTAEEAFACGDLSENFLKRYQKRWMEAFGADFAWSSRLAAFASKRPGFLDAFAARCVKKGDEFMAQWGMIMTGARPKRKLFRPGMALPLLFEALRQRRNPKRFPRQA
jgi:menaquinone-9 beta-reductase